MEIPDFLSRKYNDLPGSKSVERAVQKKLREGKTGPSTKEDRIRAYLDRLEEFFQDKEKFERLKYKILNTYVTKYEEIPESYWKAHERIMLERGESGDWSSASEQQKEEVKRHHAEQVLHDQRASLEQWIDYFASSDSDYVPKALKYWIFRNVLNLSEFDKQNKQFPKRSKGTVKPFPDINHEALSYVVDAVIKKLRGQGMEYEHDIQPAEREAFNQFLAREDFSSLYSWANELMHPIPERLLPITEGEWIKYPKGSDSENLIQSIRGQGTGWCTAGENTAKTQLQAGDFYVYYSLDDEGKARLPRLAIRMEGDKIAEVRGIAYKQNIDPYIVPVLEDKLKEFGKEGEVYQKKSSNMQKMTELASKQKQGEPFDKEDLVFLYELESSIEGFGYKKDPRIAELRKMRSIEDDMPIVFECTKEQIARSLEEIRQDTKAYVGKLKPGIFSILPKHIEYIYTSFPEGKIYREDLTIGGKSKEMLLKELEETGIFISSYVRDILRSRDFVTQNNQELITLVRVKVRDLGFSSNPTTNELYERARQFGLELCPAEVGPHYRLKYKDQPPGEWIFVGMKQITDSDGNPRVFNLARYDDGERWLHAYWAIPDDRWRLGDEVVFVLRN